MAPVVSSAPPGPIIYQAASNIPTPKFDPKLETAEYFIDEVEVYMRRKRIPQEDWVIMLSQVFNQDSEQSIWWKRAKMVAKTWDDFKSHFNNSMGRM